MIDWSDVDFCDVFISCLDSHSDGTHSLQRIHWWATNVNLHFSKSVLMKKKPIYILDGLKWTHLNFLNELVLFLQLLSSYTIFPRGPECSVRQFLQQGGRKSSDRSQELNINCIDDLLTERFGWNKDSSVKLQSAYVTKVLPSSLKVCAGHFLCCFSISHCHSS